MNQLAEQSVTIVVPLLNEEATVPQLVSRICAALADVGQLRIQIVDDGSKDGTVQAVRNAARLARASRISIRRLSRNFGLQRSIIAGIDAALEGSSAGGIVVVMDGDLQDRPEDIPLLLQALQGADIACAIRATRRESVLFRVLAFAFYSLFQRWAQIDVPANAGNFCAMTHRAAACVARNADENVFFPGLRAWVGFMQVGVAVNRDARVDGDSRMGYRRLVRLAIGALFGYSQLPLKLMVGLSGLSLLISILLASLITALRIMGRVEIQGIALLVVITLFCFSIVSIFLTTLAYMVSRNPSPTQHRQLYVVAEDIHLEPIRA